MEAELDALIAAEIRGSQRPQQMILRRLNIRKDGGARPFCDHLCLPVDVDGQGFPAVAVLREGEAISIPLSVYFWARW